jgi:hypothetical protein
MASRAGQAPPLYYGDDPSAFDELPANLLSPKSPQAPVWLQIILQRWPALKPKSEASNARCALMRPTAKKQFS